MLLTRIKKLYNYKVHIPTKEQCEELIKYTKNYWVNNYDPNKIKHNRRNDVGIKGLNGRVFIGQNGNQLFIPAAGYRHSFEISNDKYGCYVWSANLKRYDNLCSYNSYFVHCLEADLHNVDICFHYRYSGFSIRPVINL